jgi:hypothetical protein
MRLALAIAASLFAGQAPAQDPAEQLAVVESDGAILRALDTMTGKLTDLDVSVGQMVSYQRLEITLGDCRYPQENPASDAFAYITIRDVREAEPRFAGWMVASSPALSAMDHPRYDVWVLRCHIPKAAETDPPKSDD